MFMIYNYLLVNYLLIRLFTYTIIDIIYYFSPINGKPKEIRQRK